MDKNVKFIFKCLIGTAALIVVSALFIEFLNISLRSLQLHQMTKTAARQSCVLFSQETYKQRDNNGTSGLASLAAGSVNMQDIYAADGSPYVSGTFYSGTDARSIYDSIYNFSGTEITNEFKGFINKNVKDSAYPSGYAWRNIGLTAKFLNGEFSRTTMPDVTSPTYMNPTTHEINFTLYNQHMDEYTEYALGKNYYDNLVTPLNFGVPYLDRKTVTNMYKWNLTQILSNCSSEAIVKDSNGEYYVSYSGYRVYTQDAKISGIFYRIFDLTVESEKADFTRITNIDPDNLSFSDDITYMGTEDDERRRICVAGIQYSVPVGYDGITWLSSLIGFAENLGNKQGLAGGLNESGDFTQKPLLTGGGLNGDPMAGQNGVLAVPGELVYYVVR